MRCAVPRADHNAPADLEGALYEMGVEVWRSTDDEVTALCPGHEKRTGRQDSHPSWSVNRTTGLHNCYSCGFSGTFIDLVMFVLFPHDVFRAARWMRQFGVNLTTLHDLAAFADTTKERVVEQAELVPETRLAMYADVPDWALEARSLERASVDHYGIRWNDKNDAWIIPVRTPEAELAGWQEKWEGKRRFMNRPRDMLKSLCLFGLDVFPVGEPAVLLESPLDVVRLHSAGWEGGLATYGAEVSSFQKQLLLSVTDELVDAHDNDHAGRTAAAELRSGRWEQGKMVAPPVTRALYLRYFSYKHTDEKDVGGMGQADIERGLYEAQHWRVAVLGTEEQEKAQRELQRRAKAVPAARRRANGRPRAVPAVRRRGHRQDPDDRRRRRGAR